MKILLLYIGVVVVLLSFYTYLYHTWAATPVVQTSYSTGQCVKVINFVETDEYSCENMPERYSNEWVK